jgi:hypothetical protein
LILVRVGIPVVRGMAIQSISMAEGMDFDLLQGEKKENSLTQ